MKKILFILIFLPLLQAFGLDINPKTSYVFLDVRSIQETKADSLKTEIAPSLIVPYDEAFAKKIDSISKYKNNSILIFCRSGARAENAKGLLEKAGFKHIHNLKTLANAKAFEKELRKVKISKIPEAKAPEKKAPARP